MLYYVMIKSLDPKQFGLPARTILQAMGKKHVILVIDRKSRIIMADGEKIMKKAEKIRRVLPEVKISLRISGPICSKTEAFLKDHEINLIAT